MPPREIDHVDIITHAGSVRRIVVVTENRQMVQLTDRNLRDIWHQIIGDPGGIFPDEAGGMRSDRIEVAKKDNAPGSVGVRNTLKNLLDHEFGPSVWIGAA